MNQGKFWLSKLKESAISTAPIALVVLVIYLLERFGVFGAELDPRYLISDNNMIAFGISVVLIVLGMMLFNVGTEQSMSEIGQVIGGSLAKKNIFFVIVMTAMLGILVTVAEPDLAVLSGQIGVNEQIIVWTIGVGVGIFLVIGVLRVLFRKNLNILFLSFYALAFALLYIIDPRFLPICFDSGGVTTGPVTVPFLLGFGLGMAASHGKGHSSEDSFGLTGLCSIGPILSVVIIALIMKSMGMNLPLMDDYVDPLTRLSDNIGENLRDATLSTMQSVAFSVVPILGFFLIYELIFVRLPWKNIFRVFLGMAITYAGLVCFLAAVESGFMPIASKLGQGFGSNSDYAVWALVLGGLFGVFGVLAEPAVHVLVAQIETVSDGAIKKTTVLAVMAGSIGVAVVLHLVRAYFEFDLMYYLIPGYILTFALSFVVPKIYTAMAFDSGGVASGPMTSTFILPFCIGFSYGRYASTGAGDVYLYGFGLVAMVALMPLIVLQTLGLQSVWKKEIALSRARKRIIEENDEQVVHFEEESA